MLVSLTTIPPRSKHIDPVIRNLLCQTVKPTEIILNICHQYHRFPNQTIELTDFVRNNVTINYCKDLGPICKIMGATDKCGPIMVVDDDSILPLNAIEKYLEYRQILPDSVLCFRGKILDGRAYNVLPNVLCTEIKQPAKVNFLAHVWSACYDAKYLHGISVNSYCHNDDVVVSGTLQKSGKEIYVIPNKWACSPTNQHNNADLWSINRVSDHTDELIGEYYEF